MDDLISRQTIMNAFAKYVRRSNNSDFAPVPRWNDAVEIVENLPSVDAVEVVRCADCKHSYETFAGLICSHGVCVDCVVRDDFYCSNGERKDE